MLHKPSRLYVWLPLGLAAYCFVAVIDDARKSDWRKVPAQDLVSVQTGEGFETIRDVLGRPQTKWTGGRSVLRYRYVVDGTAYGGSWNGGVRLVRPVSVLYDPDDPERSTLEIRRPGPVVQGLGWASLALGLTALILRRKLPEASVEPPPSEHPEEPSSRARSTFRGLVITDFSIHLIRRLFDLPGGRLPGDVLLQIDRHLPPGPLQKTAVDLYPVAFLLALFASLGLLSFWRPARHLYVITWCWWLAVGGLSVASIDYGLDGFLRHLSWLLGGAIVAVSFYGPIGRAFEARPPGKGGDESRSTSP